MIRSILFSIALFSTSFAFSADSIETEDAFFGRSIALDVVAEKLGTTRNTIENAIAQVKESHPNSTKDHVRSTLLPSLVTTLEKILAKKREDIQEALESTARTFFALERSSDDS